MNENYIQQNGVAMESPLGPVLADIFMSNLENKLNRFSKNKSQLWLRYVDNIFCIFDFKQNITNVLKKINKWHNNIRFTVEMEENNQISFLNVRIIKNPAENKFETTVYKKTNQHQFFICYMKIINAGDTK